MRARRMLGAIALAAVLVAGAGCGSSSSSGGGGQSGGIKEGGVFSLGTTNYIDTLNPFNYIEAEAVTAYLEVYPELVQLGPDLATFEGSYASKWEHSADFKTWTYTLHSGGKWSDGEPLSSEDVAWTANTVVEYQDAATANLASAIAHVTSVETDGPDKVIFHYDAAVDEQLVLSNISALYILPEHVWSQYLGSNGKDLKNFRPENSLPLVSGGPYQITQYEKKGTTVFKPNPGWWGAKPHVQAVGITYYTNSDSMIADLQSGQISAVDQVPYTAVKALQSAAGLVVQPYKYGEFTNITWNSNPAKPQNRELLDPKVKQALSMCVDREQIISVIYAGNATLASPSVLGPFAPSWQSPDNQELTYDCDTANSTLDSLGYTKGADGIRVAPATTGKYAQPAHKMQYQIMVPGTLDFNGDREFSIVQAGFAQAGVKVTEQAGGDSDSSFAIETAENCDGDKGTGYSKFDIALWDWFSYPDPDFMLSVATKGQWCSWNDQGYDNSEFDSMYEQQGALAGDERKQLVQQMDKMLADQFIYTQLVNEKAISAVRDNWSGYNAAVAGYNYSFLLSPYQKG